MVEINIFHQTFCWRTTFFFEFYNEDNPNRFPGPNGNVVLLVSLWITNFIIYDIYDD